MTLEGGTLDCVVAILLGRDVASQEVQGALHEFALPVAEDYVVVLKS